MRLTHEQRMAVINANSAVSCHGPDVIGRTFVLANYASTLTESELRDALDDLFADCGLIRTAMESLQRAFAPPPAEDHQGERQQQERADA